MRTLQILLLVLTFDSCHGQQNKNLNNSVTKGTKAISKIVSIYGEWKCVATDYRGYQKFSIRQAETIENSDLFIQKDSMYRKGINFIRLCKYYTLKKEPYDTSEYIGASFEYKYSKSELSKMFTFIPVDRNGERACYNECAHLYLKQDTLINICGGYTYYLIKVGDGKEQ